MRVSLFLAFLVVGPAGGCGANAPPSAPREQPDGEKGAEMLGGGTAGLAAFGAVYRSFQDARGRPPTAYQELASYALDASRPLSPSAMGFDVVWGGGMGPMCRDADASVVVLASAPPVAAGVPVLMADGTARIMPPEEFKGAKKTAVRNP